MEALRQAPAAEVAEPTTPTGKVENIVVTSTAEASPAVTRLLVMATEQAERLVGESQVEAQRVVNEARAEAETVIDGANRKAHETLTDARTRADRIESEARVNAERVTGEAQANAESVNTDAERRRAELFSALESERDWLRGRVDHLRAFEDNYRKNLTAHLQSQIAVDLGREPHPRGCARHPQRTGRRVGDPSSGRPAGRAELTQTHQERPGPTAVVVRVFVVPARVSSWSW